MRTLALIDGPLWPEPSLERHTLVAETSFDDRRAACHTRRMSSSASVSTIPPCALIHAAPSRPSLPMPVRTTASTRVAIHLRGRLKQHIDRGPMGRVERPTSSWCARPRRTARTNVRWRPAGAKKRRPASTSSPPLRFDNRSAADLVELAGIQFGVTHRHVQDDPRPGSASRRVTAEHSFSACGPPVEAPITTITSARGRRGRGDRRRVVGPTRSPSGSRRGAWAAALTFSINSSPMSRSLSVARAVGFCTKSMAPASSAASTCSAGRLAMLMIDDGNGLPRHLRRRRRSRPSWACSGHR